MKVAVFDLDGTLLDSTRFWNSLARTYLERQGLKPSEDLQKTMESLTVKEGLAHMQTGYGLDKSLEQIRSEIDEILFSYYKNDAELKPFARDLIKILKSRNIRLAIASVTDEELIAMALKRLGIYEDFKFIETCGRLGLNKDDEEFFHQLSERLASEPKDIFLFEDSLYSMKTAKKAGFKIVAVEDHYARKDLREILETCDIYIKDFASLMELLSY